MVLYDCQSVKSKHVCGNLELGNKGIWCQRDSKQMEHSKTIENKGWKWGLLMHVYPNNDIPVREMSKV